MNQQLDEQIKFLTSSLNAWQDNESEAKRMSVSLRVLFHDTRNSHSISKQVGIKDNLKFPDTKAPTGAFAYWNISNIELNFAPNIVDDWPYHGLVAKTLQADVKDIILTFTPLYLHPQFNLDHHPTIDFSEWWNGVVFDDHQGNTLTRKDLTLIAANKDGGAHVDPDGLPSKYQRFKDTDLLKLKNEKDTAAPFDTIPAYAAIAQISYEALSALGHTPT